MANGKDDIRVALGWPRHYKRRALQRELGPAGPLALIDLWCFAGEHRPDGVFKSSDEVEIAVDWPKRRRGQLVAALVSSGWLEPDGVTLHDWTVEQPWIANRPARLAAARASGAEGGRRSAEARAEAGYGPRGPDGKWGRSGAEANTEANTEGTPKADRRVAEPPIPSPSPSPIPTPKNPLPPSGDPPPVGGKPKRRSDPVVASLRARIGCGTRQAADQVRSLRLAGWTDDRIERAIEDHGEPGLAPWDWTKRAVASGGTRAAPLTKPDGSLTVAGILAAGRAMDARAEGLPLLANKPGAV